MIKGVGIFLIFSSCGSLGLLKSSEYRRYCNLLQEILLAIELLETEIQYNQNPLGQAFYEVGHRLNPEAAGLLFNTAHEFLINQPDQLPIAAWHKGVLALFNIVPKYSPLLDYLQSFGQGLGLSDRQSQAKLFILIRQQIKQCLIDAEEKKASNERMWQYLGFCAGAGLIIVLI